MLTNHHPWDSSRRIYVSQYDGELLFSSMLESLLQVKVGDFGGFGGFVLFSWGGAPCLLLLRHTLADMAVSSEWCCWLRPWGRYQPRKEVQER